MKIFLNLILLFTLSTSLGFTNIEKCFLDNEPLIESYIEARNSFDTSRIVSLLDQNYKEVFSDGSIEIKNIEHLVEVVLWGKEIESNIKLINIKSNGDKIVTIEEHSNYIDVALKRKHRKFKVIYTVKKGKILNQKLEYLKGYKKIEKFNKKCWEEFIKYCDNNRIHFDSSKMNKEFAINLKKALKQYMNSRK